MDNQVTTTYDKLDQFDSLWIALNKFVRAIRFQNAHDGKHHQNCGICVALVNAETLLKEIPKPAFLTGEEV